MPEVMLSGPESSHLDRLIVHYRNELARARVQRRINRESGPDSRPHRGGHAKRVATAAGVLMKYLVDVGIPAGHIADAGGLAVWWEVDENEMFTLRHMPLVRRKIVGGGA